MKKIISPLKKFKEDGDKLDGEEINGNNKIKFQLKVNKIFQEGKLN